MKKETHGGLSALIIVLLVSGCAAIPEQIILITDESRVLPSAERGDCESDKLLREPNGPVLSRHKLDADNISLFNWNIHKGKSKNWTEDFLKHSGEDHIIVLQEALLTPELRALLGKKNLYWDLNASFYFSGLETGVMTASTVQPLYQCGLRIREPLLGTPKTTLISRFQVSGPGEHLLVANIHGINFSLGTGAYRRQIKALTNVLSKHTGPLIVAGDFNSWSDKRVSIVKEMVETLGLDAIPYKTHRRLKIFGKVVDHVFYDGLDLVSQDIIEVTSSDHNPIRVTFKTAESNAAKTR